MTEQTDHEQKSRDRESKRVDQHHKKRRQIKESNDKETRRSQEHYGTNIKRRRNIERPKKEKNKVEIETRADRKRERNRDRKKIRG